MPGPRFKKTEAPFRGPTRSEDWNELQDSLEFDLQRDKDDILNLRASHDRLAKLTELEFLATRNRLRRLEQQQDDERKQLARAGAIQSHFLDYRRMEPFYFIWPTNDPTDTLYTPTWEIPLANRLRLDPEFGQAILPFNNVVNRFHNVDPDSGDVVVLGDLEATVTAVAEDGALNVKQTEINNAFNGQNNSYYVREVRYPLQSDVEEVMVDIEVKVPVSNGTYANMLTINPHPSDMVDIIGVWYSSSPSGTPDIPLPGHVSGTASFPRSDSGWVRYHFRQTAVGRIKIRLRQRTFVERNGFKLFTYGLQELGLQLVEYDQSALTTDALPGNAVVARLEAPEGFKYSQVRSLFADPDPITTLPVRYQMFTSETLSTGSRVYDSDTDTTPSIADNATWIDVAASNATELWIVIAGGWSVPDEVTPIFESFGIQFTTEVV